MAKRTGHFKRNVLSLLIAGFVLVAAAGQSLAQKPFLERLRKVYALEKEKNGSCKLCHDFNKEKGEGPEMENIGVFGKALQATPEFKPLHKKGDEHKFTPDELDLVQKAMKSLEDKDLDGDGASNKEELALGTFPGNKDSVPAKDVLEKYRKDNPAK